MSDEIPRLFVLLTGGLDGEPIADGVLWPDGAVSVRRLDPPATEAWTGWDDPAAAEVHDGTVSVLWRRQDTYTDQQEGTP